MPTAQNCKCAHRQGEKFAVLAQDICSLVIHAYMYPQMSAHNSDLLVVQFKQKSNMAKSTYGLFYYMGQGLSIA